MRIFFANIGNRNLKWNQEFTAHLNGFRDATKFLLENYDKFIEEIAAQIIPPLLSDFGTYDKIILVATDGSHEQDTIYAAEIVKRLLIKKFPNYQEEQIQIQRLKDAIIDDEKVLNFYKGAFYQLLKLYENQFELHICDAGGTPQQKLAMKIMADFLIPEEQLKILYINQQNISTLVNLTGYRNIIQAQAVIRLIQTGSYRAALVLRNREDILFGNLGKNKADKLIRLGYYLINNQWPLKLKQEYKGNQIPKDPTLDKLTENLFGEEPCLGLNPFEGMKNQWFLCSQNYYLTRFYLEQNEFNKAVLCFANFYEKFYNDLARKFLGDELSNKEKDRNSFLELLFDKVAIHFPNEFKPFREGVPHMSRLAALITDGNIKKAVLAINEGLLEYKLVKNEETQDYQEVRVEKKWTIDSFRNSIAHEGKVLEQEEEKWLKETLGLILDKVGIFLNWNQFEQLEILNSCIENYLKEKLN